MKTCGRLASALFIGMAVYLAIAPVSAHADENACLNASAAGCTFGLPSFQYQLLLNEMIAHPKPDVRQLDVDPAEMAVYSGASRFSGVLIDQPLAYPVAWVLSATIPVPIPGTNPTNLSDHALNRYDMVNIFATTTVNNQEWYLVGPGQWISQSQVARLMPVDQLGNLKGRGVAIDLAEQVLVAYQDGQMVFATLISSGIARFPTNEGQFNIWARREATRMTGEMGTAYGYDLADVPWVMYFDNSISLHGAYWHDRFGEPRSHGCINMSITDAHWLYDWTSGFYANTWVYVWQSGGQTFLAKP